MAFTHRHEFVIKVAAYDKYDRKTRQTTTIPQAEHRITIDIDADTIAKILGIRAAKNKTKKAGALHGTIMCKATPFVR